MPTAEKREVPVCTSSLIVEYFIQNETVLRNLFFKGRESSIKSTGGFSFKDITIKTSLLSLYEESCFISNTDSPMVFVSIQANYDIRKNRKWTQESTLLGHGCIASLPTTEQEWDILRKEIELKLNELAQMSMHNWKNFLPMFKEYFDDIPSYTTFLWFDEYDFRIVTTTSYTEIAELLDLGNLGNNNYGFIRRIDFKSYLKESDCSSIQKVDSTVPLESKVHQNISCYDILTKANLGSISSLAEHLEKEKEFNRVKELLIKMLD